MSGTRQDFIWRGMPLGPPWTLLATPEVWMLATLPPIQARAQDILAILDLPTTPLPLPDDMIELLLGASPTELPIPPRPAETGPETGMPGFEGWSWDPADPVAPVPIPEPASTMPVIPTPLPPTATVWTEGGPLTWRIQGGADAPLFLLDPATGALSFLAKPDPDHPADADGDNLYEVTLEVKDVWGTASILHRQVRVTAETEDEPIPLPFRADEMPAPVDQAEAYGPRDWGLF